MNDFVSTIEYIGIISALVISITGLCLQRYDSRRIFQPMISIGNAKIHDLVFNKKHNGYRIEYLSYLEQKSNPTFLHKFPNTEIDYISFLISIKNVGKLPVEITTNHLESENLITKNDLLGFSPDQSKTIEITPEQSEDYIIHVPYWSEFQPLEQRNVYIGINVTFSKNNKLVSMGKIWHTLNYQTPIVSSW